MSVSVAIKNVAETCGEGPHWEEATQSLMTVDALANKIIKWNSVTGETEKKSFDELCTFIIPRERDGYVTTQFNKIITSDWDNHFGNSTLATVDVDGKTRFNDGKCDRTGRLWAGTLANGRTELGLGTLYSISPHGDVRTHADKTAIANGMTWSLDGTRMFFVDSWPRKIWVFDCDLDTGSLTNQRIFSNQPETLGYPDGMTTDAEGKLWVACYSASKIIRLDPETGKLIQEVTFPVAKTTSLCFGGPHYDEIYVTSDRSDITESELQSQPLAGSVFKVTGLGIKGLPQYNFAG